MKIILSFLLTVGLVTPSWADDSKPFENLDYPELQVVPRATERLAQLAQLEQESAFLNQWTLLASGAMTLLAGTQSKGKYKENPSNQEKKDADLAANLATGIGAGWVVVGSYLAFKKPAANGLSGVRKMSTKDRRADLARERWAEEAMESASNLQTTLSNMAVVTNLAASVLLTSQASDDQTRTYGLLAATTSLLPWVFPSIYNVSYKKHLEYKRKIYAPLVWMDLKGHDSAQMNLSWSF